MKAKLWVGISLVVFVVLVVNIIGFGILQDYSVNNNNVILIINKNDTYLNNSNLGNSTILDDTNTQNIPDNQNQVTTPIQDTPIVINNPPRLITRAS
jgi:hypothetical protein